MLAEYSRESGAGITVYATGRSLKRLEERFRGCPEGTVRLIEYDVNAPADFGFDADFIIHAAGNAYPAAFAGDPVGTVMGNITSRRGLLTGNETRPGVQVVNAEVPLGEMFGYATDLRSQSQGRGNFTMEFLKYAEVPRNIAEGIIGQRKKAEN
mgnify:CR=1 FL=1